MKPYLSLFRVRFINGLQYRASALGGLATQFFWGLMLVFIYEAFYQSTGTTNGFSYKDLVTLTWLNQAFLSLVYLYDWDSELLDSITTGGISYELCRPVSMYQMWYTKLLSKRVARVALRALPIVVAGFLLPEPYNLSLPQSLVSFLLFAVALFLGAFLLVAISMLVFISVFKTMSPIGSVGISGSIGEFFAGMTIPIPLMPASLQKVCMVLPFRYTSDLPFRVYSGHINTAEALRGIAVQMVWIAVLILIGSVIMKKVTRLSVVQGG